MLTSLLINNAHLDFELYAIVDGVTEANLAAIEETCKNHGRLISFVSIDNDLVSFFKVDQQFSQAAYFRIYGPDLIDVQRILYLDVDLIVQIDIGLLLELEIGDNIIAGAPDSAGNENFRKRLKLPKEAAPYVNTGVLLVDADRWREEETTKELVKYYLSKKDALKFADQDLINACLAGRICILPQHWNLQCRHLAKDKIDCLKASPSSFQGILHYNTLQKPWKAQAQEPYRSLYQKYAVQSPIRMPEKQRHRRRFRTSHWKATMRRIKRMKRRISRLLRRFVHSLACRMAGRILSVSNFLNTTPHSYAEPSFSVHMLTCHKDIEMALWSLRTFACFAKLSPPVFIHDDGTLTTSDINSFHKYVPRVTVIRRSEAEPRLEEWLKDYPHCRKTRMNLDLPLAIKLFDPWVYAPYDAILLLDSDMLFFRRPEELLLNLRQNRPCFNADYQDSYSAPITELRHSMGMDIMPEINSGLLAMTRDNYDLDLIERSLESFPPTNQFYEQTAYALLLSKSNAERLGDAHQISRQPITARTVSHHFVSDGSRLHFWTKGAWRLIRQRDLRPPREMPG